MLRRSTVRGFMAGRDQPAARGQRLRCLPGARQLDAIDAITPGIPVRQRRLFDHL
jgi:hypothetical protein